MIFCDMDGVLTDFDGEFERRFGMPPHAIPRPELWEKVLAANRAGIATVFLPEQNRADVEEIPAEFRQNLACQFFTHALDVVEATRSAGGGA